MFKENEDLEKKYLVNCSVCVFFAVVLLFPVSMCLCPDVNKIHND